MRTLRQPLLALAVLGGASRSRSAPSAELRGNAACFDGEFTYELCCVEQRECWDSFFSPRLCCSDGDRWSRKHRGA